MNKVNKLSREEYNYLVSKYNKRREEEIENWLPLRTEAFKPSCQDLLYIINNSIITEE